MDRRIRDLLGWVGRGDRTLSVEPKVGIEPTTYALRVRCSTD